jgi:hypothetical protein
MHSKAGAHFQKLLTTAAVCDLVANGGFREGRSKISNTGIAAILTDVVDYDHPSFG